MTTDAADKAAVDLEDEGDDAEEDENDALRREGPEQSGRCGNVEGVVWQGVGGFTCSKVRLPQRS